jgi:hypothetical protein
MWKIPPVPCGKSIISLPSGKRLHNYGKIHHFQWVNPLEITIFNSYVTNYQRVVEEQSVDLKSRDPRNPAGMITGSIGSLFPEENRFFFGGWWIL